MNVLPIFLPPLRERGDDILLLAYYFLQQYAREYKPEIIRFSPDAIAKIQRELWPGNIRELSNRIIAAVIRANGDTIQAGDITGVTTTLYPVAQPSGPAFALTSAELQQLFGQGQPPTLELLTSRFGQFVVGEALKASGGDVKEAASLLGIPVKKLKALRDGAEK